MIHVLVEAAKSINFVMVKASNRIKHLYLFDKGDNITKSEIELLLDVGFTRIEIYKKLKSKMEIKMDWFSFARLLSSWGVKGT